MGLTATIFVPTALVEQGREFWWDELERLIIGFAGNRLVADGEEIDLGRPEPGDELWPPASAPATRRQRALHRIWSRVRTKPLEDIDRLLSELRAVVDVPTTPRPNHRLMTPEEIKAVASEGVKIGSHALTHPSLPALSAERRTMEVRDSIAACQAMTGERPSAFAYPFGDYEGEIEELVKSCGFACACTVDRDPVGPEARRYALPRIGVGNWPAPLLKRVLLEL